jgi:hypothetical protein
LGATLNPGAAGAGATARIFRRACADRVEGTSLASVTAGLLTVAAPAANAIPNATIGAANIKRTVRPDTPIASGSVGALMPLAIKRSLNVGPAITRSPVTRGSDDS